MLGAHVIDLAHFFHVRPWELGELSPVELYQMLDAIDDMKREAAKTHG